MQYIYFIHTQVNILEYEHNAYFLPPQLIKTTSI